MSEEAFFIDDNTIENLLLQSENIPDSEVIRIIDKAEQFGGLTPSEVAALLTTTKQEHWQRIFEVAGKIKKHIYGERIVMFAPLYVSDYCVNNCTYCGFNCKEQFTRRRLTQDEIRAEVRILEQMGHKRLALEAGEDPVHCPIEYILECIETIYAMKTKTGEIRRVNINIAATTVENYKKLLDAKIGTYILFQETYKQSVYEQMHLGGPKRDYHYHTTAFDRAMEAGIEDVGGGVLFGLYDYRYEILGLMLHNEHLENTFGVGFHTISVPRICDTESVDHQAYPYSVDDETFKKLVAVIRLAVPFTGMIVSTRESKEMRKELIALGISQLSAGSSVDVFGYSEREKQDQAGQESQFTLADSRPAQDVIYWLLEENLIPSFCTACYRSGRTGDRFMSLAKSGQIKNVCLPNALMTLLEYSLDYGDERLQTLADRVITQKIQDIENETVREIMRQNIEKMKTGQRDLFL